MRSAMDPEISAGVMIANINWKAANTIVGIVTLGAVRGGRPFIRSPSPTDR